jgi:Mg2+ and Co2+ transporter CorA
VQTDGRRIALVAFAVDERGLPTAVHVHVGEGGVLVLCADDTAPLVRRAVAGVAGRPEDALVAVLLALAQLSEDAIERLSADALALDASTTGLTSGARRRAVSRARSLLFSLQQLWAAHQRTLVSDDMLIEILPPGTRPALRRAGGIFESTSSAAGQLYALLGDTLSRQATIINERLTLVAVVFFPLTVSTGFFGMNFGWLTARIGSAAAFALLGVVLPCVLVAATLLGARWLTRD